MTENNNNPAPLDIRTGLYLLIALGLGGGATQIITPHPSQAFIEKVDSRLDKIEQSIVRIETRMEKSTVKIITADSTLSRLWGALGKEF